MQFLTLDFWSGYLNLIFSGIVTVVITMLLRIFSKSNAFNKINKIVQQILIGLIFGLVASFGNQFTISISGILIGTSVAAPLCAGIFFGGPAGIIAGVIGGIERYFSVMWGGDLYTQIANSIILVFAGLLAAFLRNIVFDKKNPAWSVSFATGIVIETIHMIVLFVLNIKDAMNCFNIIKAITLPLMISTSLIMLISSILVSIVDAGHRKSIKNTKSITQKMQRAILIVVILSYICSTVFIYFLNTYSLSSSALEEINNSTSQIVNIINSNADEAVLSTINSAKKSYLNNTKISLEKLASSLHVDEINIINSDGIIKKSSNEDNLKINIEEDSELSSFMVLTNPDSDYLIKPLTISNSYEIADNIHKYAAITLKNGDILQLSYGYYTYTDIIKKIIDEKVPYTTIGNDGVILYSNHSQNIIKGTEEAANLNDLGIDITLDTEFFGFKYATFNDKKVVYKSTEVESFNIISVLDQEEVFHSRDSFTYINSFVQVLIFAIIFTVVFIKVNRLVVKDLREINRGVENIADGVLSYVFNDSNTLEFDQLTDNINETVKTIKDFKEKEAERIKIERDLARKIQLSALPLNLPNVEKYRMAASLKTTEEVGADFYDFYKIDETRVAFVIADVSGKGVTASMFMIATKTIIKSLVENGEEINEIFNQANEKLCEDNTSNMFVTAWMGILDIETGHVKYVNAGQLQPIIYSNNDGYIELDSKPGFVLGGLTNSKYNISEFDLKPGERIFLYTDGLTESTNSLRKTYGQQRLIEFLNTISSHDIDTTINEIAVDLENYVGSTVQKDDITMFMIQYNGNQKFPKVFDAEAEEKQKEETIKAARKPRKSSKEETSTTKEKAKTTTKKQTKTESTNDLTKTTTKKVAKKVKDADSKEAKPKATSKVAMADSVKKTKVAKVSKKIDKE